MQVEEAETSLTPCDRLQNVLDLVREFIGDRFDDMDAAVAKVVGPPLRSLGPGAAYPLGICAGVVVAACVAVPSSVHDNSVVAALSRRHGGAAASSPRRAENIALT